ncbi:MAG: cryptochrome/photolyase family protein [Flammeovirgaceae bacterium]
MKEKVSIFWHRRDLRIADNAGLYHALKNEFPVLPIFIFDRHILDELQDRADQRVSFIHHWLTRVQEELKQFHTSLKVMVGTPQEAWTALMEEFDIQAVYTNHDYEPYAIHRDQEIQQVLASQGIAFHSFKDQCIFEKEEVVKDDGRPYTVFTPYSRKWMKALNPTESDFYLRSYPVEKYTSNFLKVAEGFRMPSLETIGFTPSTKAFPKQEIDEQIIENYGEQRDFPAIKGTTRLSVHLRFGTISIRKLARIGLKKSQKWLNELIWRDFYMMILYHFPHVVDSAFKPAYNHIPWRNDEQEFNAWCEGKTGYPIVDAGMRELNATGFMHNRVRMIVASFLIKHLLIDWRWGEAYFAEKLLDFDLSANNGGWQWAASSGCDAVPYFRIFNPTSQTKKFDPNFEYIRKWVPEFQAIDYQPIVEHKFARERVLKVYKDALEAQKVS